ncbi:sulfate transporter family-domain-containing protein [Coemansia spiralis]|nr:sulfate transporter family-domain-containing protein [Coemansia spiralis]
MAKLADNLDYNVATPEQEPILYVEPLASSKEWIKHNVIPTQEKTATYVKSLFPIFSWIYRYNWTWFVGDLVAGVTVGVVVVPQGMAYAKLAQLSPEFGLYSSFVGCALYFMFATSKDITIGPVAVMSTLMGNILNDVLPKLPEYKDQPWVIAGCLSLILGCIVTALGVLRLGFIVDFIPLPAIAAFMTGSALNIAMGQIPTLMGNNSVKAYNTRAPTYLVFGNFFKYIKHCNINAAVGLTALFLLYLIRWACSYSARRWPQREKVFFFISTLRTAFVILLYTLISWLVNRHHHSDPKFSILGTVPRGLKHMAVPTINSHILSAVAGKIPSAIIVLVIEHISISKSFGRINNYVINPNQELIAIGITNIFGPFFGAYPATGSFSRTAIKSKAGVRTPLAGVITAAIVIIAIYALPPVFYYISNALLAAVIIHAVGDLITAPKTLKMFWRISPFEFFIFWAGVLVSVFSSIDNGIYTSVATSAALLLFRIAKAKGKFIGMVKVYEHPAPLPSSTEAHDDTGNNMHSEGRNVFVSLDRSEGTNPSVRPVNPPSGIYIYRLNEGYLYPNAVHFTDHMVGEIMAQTRPGISNPYGSLGNRPWNDPGPRHKDESDVDPSLPLLRAIVLDFTGVSNVDITSIQNLVDVRKQLDRYANDIVSWHFAGIKSPWTRRALIAGGFGSSDSATRTVFSVANVGVVQDKDVAVKPSASDYDEEISVSSEDKQCSSGHGKGRSQHIDHPYFHIDLDEALKATELELGLK